MYEELFQSPARPFRATPDARFYFPHDCIESARNTVVRAARRAEGPVMVLGGAGLGKSLLSVLVAQDLNQEFDVIKLHAARLCSRKALLQNILFELQLPYKDLSEGELRLSILDRMEPNPDFAKQGLLILVDEAHTLPLKLLEELRLITNFTRDAQPRARLVLIGSMQLEDMFASPQMESFNQRLAARCYLTPMSREQTTGFVEHQIRAAGYNPPEFITSEGLQSVYAASEGVPRLANQIMDHALVLAITQNQCPVSAALVEEAWADLQQLPAPWQSAADRQTQSTGNPVEFATLDDDNEFSSNDLQPSSAVVDSVSDGDDAPTAAESSDSPAHEPEFSTELTSVDEEDDAPSQPAAESNFFAAFAEPQPNELPEAINEVPPVEQEIEPDIVKPQVVFDASTAFDTNSVQVGVELASESETLPTDSFFNDRPTDEKMIALTDEQAQYDAMGVWENDPPLDAGARADLDPSSSEILAVVAAPAADEATADVDAEPECSTAEPASAVDEIAPVMKAAQASDSDTTPPPSELFGSDFDEEVAVVVPSEEPGILCTDMPSVPPANEVPINVDPSEVSGADGIVEPSKVSDLPTCGCPNEAAVCSTECNVMATANPEADTAAADGVGDEQPLESYEHFTDEQMQAVLVQDHLTRIQAFADHASEVHPDQPTVEEVLHQASAANPDTESAAPWTMDVAPVDVQREVAVHEEIEDIVSQLNFSAFAVEPYSVEQISVEPTANSEVPDSVRMGAEDEVYMMHRASARQSDAVPATAVDFDDDRDLLIIEEEVALNPQAPSESQQPPTQTKPYSQLFAKLRK